MESWFHAIPRIVTRPATLPRSAAGFATAKRAESGVAATNCRRASATTHWGDVLDGCAPWHCEGQSTTVRPLGALSSGLRRRRTDAVFRLVLAESHGNASAISRAHLRAALSSEAIRVGPHEDRARARLSMPERDCASGTDPLPTTPVRCERRDFFCDSESLAFRRVCRVEVGAENTLDLLLQPYNFCTQFETFIDKFNSFVPA